jgi:hypothetical protein
MEKKEIIELGKALGLPYREARDNSDKWVIFEGVNSQCFLILVGDPKEYTLLKLGEALISYGKKLKSEEILQLLRDP